MSTWFRWHADSVNDHKLQSLPCEAFKFYINLCSLLCEEQSKDGTIPCLETLCWRLRIEPQGAQDLVTCLFVATLLVKSRAGLQVKGWEKRQYISDTSTERVRKHRSTKRYETVTVTPPDTDTDTDTEQTQKEKEEGASAPVAGFQGRVIRLNLSDYEAWKKAYPNLDLDSELSAHDAFLAGEPADDQKRWFIRTATHLRNRNATMKAKPKGVVVGFRKVFEPEPERPPRTDEQQAAIEEQIRKAIRR